MLPLWKHEAFVRDCPEPPLSAGALDRQDFHSEDGDWGGPSSAMEL